MGTNIYMFKGTTYPQNCKQLAIIGIVTTRKSNTGEAKEPCASSCGIVEINTQVYGINNIFMHGYH